MPRTVNRLRARLDDISEALTRSVLDAIRALSLNELIELTGERPASSPPRPPTKARPSSRESADTGRPRKAPRMPSPVDPETRNRPDEPSRELRRVIPTLPSRRPRDHARDLLNAALVACVAKNPGIDAKLVAQQVGVPYGTAQSHLDDLVLAGRLKMSSGQHGRCYSLPPTA